MNIIRKDVGQEMALISVSMNVRIEFQGTTKNVLCDEGMSFNEFKQRVCCECLTSPGFTRLYYNGQLLLGNKEVVEYGVTNGSLIKVEAVGC